MHHFVFKTLKPVFGLLMLACLLAGCAGTSDPSTFYMLDSALETAKPTEIGSKSRGPVILGPIHLAAYLDRTQIVTRTDGNELAVDEFNRWAEPMKDSLYRVLQENLSSLLDTAAIYSYPEQPREGRPVQVVIDVTRFETDQEGKATLVAFWTLKGGKKRSGETSRKSVYTADAASSDYRDRVNAMNRLLADFSREIASTLTAR